MNDVDVNVYIFREQTEKNIKVDTQITTVPNHICILIMKYKKFQLKYLDKGIIHHAINFPFD